MKRNSALIRKLRTLSEESHRADAGWEVVERALAARRGEWRRVA